MSLLELELAGAHGFGAEGADTADPASPGPGPPARFGRNATLLTPGLQQRADATIEHPGGHRARDHPMVAGVSRSAPDIGRRHLRNQQRRDAALARRIGPGIPARLVVGHEARQHDQARIDATGVTPRLRRRHFAHAANICDAHARQPVGQWTILARDQNNACRLETTRQAARHATTIHRSEVIDPLHKFADACWYARSEIARVRVSLSIWLARTMERER